MPENMWSSGIHMSRRANAKKTRGVTRAALPHYCQLQWRNLPTATSHLARCQTEKKKHKENTVFDRRTDENNTVFSHKGHVWQERIQRPANILLIGRYVLCVLACTRSSNDAFERCLGRANTDGNGLTFFGKYPCFSGMLLEKTETALAND